MPRADQLSPPTGATSNNHLRRQIGIIGLTWASVGSIIGSGWLLGAKSALEAAGPAAIISWAIGAVAIILLALVHAELGGMFAISGGTARYPHYAFGGLAGMSFGWFSWLQAATVAPIEVEAMINYGQHWSWAHSFQNSQGVLTGSGVLVAILLMAVFVAVNFLGVRILAHTNSAATWWKIGVPLFTIFVFAITNFHGGNFTAAAAGGFAPFGVKGVEAAISGSGIIFALLGFEQAIQLAGESSNPKKDIPRAVLGSVTIGAVIYLLLQVVYIGALPSSSFVHGWANLAYKGISGPFAGLASVVGLGWLAVVLYIDAVISPGGTGLIYVTSTSRISYGLSRNGYVPPLFERTDRRDVPWFGLIIAFITGCICFLPFPSWKELVGFITSASVLMYAGAPLAYGVLRKQLPNRERPYRLPAGKVIAPVSFVISSLIIYWSGWDVVWRLGIAILLGYLLLGSYSWYATAKRLPNAPRLDWKAAQWLPVYLIGMGVISWQGGFCQNPGCSIANNIPLWWDMAIIAVFSLVIYYWAIAVSLKTEAIEASIADVEIVDAGGH